MVAEFSETDELPEPEAGDAIRVAALPLIEFVMEMTTHRSHERRAALCEVLTAVEKVRAALQPKPRLN
jgi:hypothetical protein